MPSICIVFLFAIPYLLLTAVHAFDRSNVPLKNWGGFAVNHSWIYDALEKVVLAGLTDEVILNTKPLSRVEAARIVAQAVRRLQEDQYGDYNHRGYLEDLLYQLVAEFGPELAEMGVRTPLNRETASMFFTLKPVEHAQLDSLFAGRSEGIVNNFGRSAAKGGNAVGSLEGRAQIGDFLSLYYQPEFSLDRDGYQGRFLSVYGKLTYWNTELLAGRESLWWGPGFRGSMTFSNNAFPLDQLRLSSAEPFHLPWLFRYLGPVKASLFLAQLEENRELPHAKVGGWRVEFAPSRYVEIGFNRIFQFGGRGRPTLKPWQFLQLLLDQGSDDPDSSLNVNNVMSLDLTLRFPDVRRYIFVARDLSLYGELGWDDTQDPGFRFLFLPTGAIIPRKPGALVGVLLTGFLGDPKLDLRVEYAKTTDIQFSHSRYTSGFTNRGFLLSHFIGTDGSEIFARTSRWISPNLLLGFQLSRAEIGSPIPALLGAPREKRDSFGFDLSYRISDRSSVFLEYDFVRIKDRGFVPGKSGNNNVFRFEYTRSFGR